MALTGTEPASADNLAAALDAGGGASDTGGVSIVLSSLEPAASRHAGAGPAGGAASKPGLPRRQPSRYGALSRMTA